MRCLRKLTAQLSVLALLLAAQPLSVAQSPAKAEPLPLDNSTLQFGVEWRLIRAGFARLAWSSGDPAHQQADLHLESAGIVSKLYRVNDDYRAIMNRELCAQTITLHAEEGKRRRDTKITFSGTKANYLETDLLKNNIVLSKELDVPPCTYEYLGALRRLRGMRLDPGNSVQIPMSDGKKFAQVRVEAQEREQVKTPLGTFRAIRYEVHMFNNVLISRNARMFIWITDDARRLPVQLRVRMAFLIGTITLQLEKEERH